MKPTKLPNNEQLLEMAVELFKAHVCEKYGACAVCSTWYSYADKFGWNDRYPTEANWAWDNDSDI